MSDSPEVQPIDRSIETLHNRKKQLLTPALINVGGCQLVVVPDGKNLHFFDGLGFGWFRSFQNRDQIPIGRGVDPRTGVQIHPSYVWASRNHARVELTSSRKEKRWVLEDNSSGGTGFSAIPIVSPDQESIVPAHSWRRVDLAEASDLKIKIGNSAFSVLKRGGEYYLQDTNGSSISLAVNQPIQIGRKTENTIFIKDSTVSKDHCTIVICGDQLLVYDKDSTNGTYVSYKTEIADKEIRENSPFEVAGKTNRGLRREKNEDSIGWLYDRQLQETLMIVADGVGNKNKGDIASSSAVNVIKRRYFELRKEGRNTKEALRIALFEAHREVKRTTSGDKTTVVAAVLDRRGKYTIANIGDSRAYLIDKGRAQRITSDNTMVMELVKNGSIAERHIYDHEYRNSFTKNLLGEGDFEDPDFYEGRLNKNQIFLLCTDGLWAMTRDPDGRVIGSIVNTASTSEKAADSLVGGANHRGGKDNIAVLLARQ